MNGKHMRGKRMNGRGQYVAVLPDLLTPDLLTPVPCPLSPVLIRVFRSVCTLVQTKCLLVSRLL
jgi:hypothetical protein